MAWLLVIIWLHFNSPNTVIEFDTQASCENAKKVIQADYETERLRLQSQLNKDNPGGNATYNPKAQFYCLPT